MQISVCSMLLTKDYAPPKVLYRVANNLGEIVIYLLIICVFV